jgi:hypothetical protein
MFVVDDPFMALILRFVVDSDETHSSEQEYLQRQLQALRRDLAPHPEAEHRARAMEWIAEHAASYRRDWERNTLASRTVYLRCADCPLAELDAAEHCEIHEQWLYLLHRYLGNERTSRVYIEEALALLSRYKEQHRHRLEFSRVVNGQSDSPKAKKGRKKKQGKKGGRKGKA